MPSEKPASLPSFSSYDYQKLGLTEEKEGKLVPIDKERLAKVALFVLRAMNAAVVFNAGEYFKVRGNKNELFDAFTTKLIKAISSKQLDPGFDFGFLLVHQEAIFSRWDKRVEAQIAPDKWSTWKWLSETLNADVRTSIEAHVKQEFTDKRRCLTLDDFAAILRVGTTDTDTLKKFKKEAVKIASGFSEHEYERDLPKAEKERWKEEKRRFKDVVQNLRLLQ